MRAQYLYNKFFPDQSNIRVTDDEGNVKFVPVDERNSDYVALLASGIEIEPAEPEEDE